MSEPLSFPTSVLIRTLQIGLAFASAALLVAYRKPFLNEVRLHWKDKLWRSLLWPPLIAIGFLISSWFFAFAYLRGILPISQPGLPNAARILVLSLFLAAMTGRWAEAKSEQFGRRYGLAMAGVVLIFVLVATFLPASTPP